MPDYLVVVNHEGRHSLWPSGSTVPSGWRQVHGPDTKQGALDYVDTHWRDQTPASVRAWLESSTPTRSQHDAS